MRLFAFLCSFSVFVLIAENTFSQRVKIPEYYQLETYYFSTPQQEQLIDNYLVSAYLPALYGLSIKNIGVFKPIANDTAMAKAIYVLIPFSNWKQIRAIAEKLQSSQDYQVKAAAFVGAPYNTPAFKRKEITLMKAFSLAPKMALPALTAPLAERIYELRSYESATDNSYRNKVHMFNEGGEMALFKKLGFNAIFYGDVVAGSKMPNLIYMTSFNSMQDRNAHWDTFGKNPEWKVISGNKMYQNNVSKIEIILTRAAAYSDY